MPKEEVKQNEADAAKAKEEKKDVNLGKNGRTNIDRINQKIDSKKLKLDEQTSQAQSFVQS